MSLISLLLLILGIVAVVAGVVDLIGGAIVWGIALAVIGLILIAAGRGRVTI